jgi:hypothetical protein
LTCSSLWLLAPVSVCDLQVVSDQLLASSFFPRVALLSPEL